MPRKRQRKKRMPSISSLLERNLKNGVPTDEYFVLGLLRISNIGMQKRKDRLPLLRKLARHKNPMARSTAIWSIGAIGDKRGLSAVRTALRDPDKSVRATAEQALLHIMKNN